MLRSYGRPGIDRLPPPPPLSPRDGAGAEITLDDELEDEDEGTEAPPLDEPKPPNPPSV